MQDNNKKEEKPIKALLGIHSYDHFDHRQYLDENSTNPFNFKEEDQEQDETRRISDPIHKFIELPKSIWRIVDTPEFQRLRYIKQLGITGFVFNGANHTRFEHCLGVAHLAWTYLDTIAKNHSYKYTQMELKDESHFNRIKLLVTIAGLCHDLGHGPFSHMFDNLLLPRLGETEWKHEKGSCMMLKSLLLNEDRDFKTKLIKYKDAKLIPNEQQGGDLEVLLDMIEGLDEKSWQEKYGDNPDFPKWVFDIISNKTTSIDVDKFDYLKRDPSGLNVKHEYDWYIIFNETRIIDGRICYNSKIHDQIYDIFHIRYKLFKHIYLHRVTQGIELMLCDALEKASSRIPFTEIIRDPKKYLKLTDSIIEIIMNQEDEELKESQEIINRIYCRNLYKFVGEIVINQDQALTQQQVIDGISKYNEYPLVCNSRTSKLTEEERNNIIVTFSKINYCFSEKDPVDSVYFFKSSKPTEKKYLNAQNSSLLRPQKFGEKIVRVFVKEDSELLINKVKCGFGNYTKQELHKESGDYDKKDNTKTPYKQEPEKRIKQSPGGENSNSFYSQNILKSSFGNGSGVRKEPLYSDNEEEGEK